MLERSQIFVSTNRFDFRTFYMQNKLPNALYVICAVLRSRLRQLLLSTIQKISSKLMISAFCVLVCIFLICINFRLRSRCDVQGLEPVTITPDGNCLYYSISKVLFGTENYWVLVKIGAITFLRSKTDTIIKRVSVYKRVC